MGGEIYMLESSSPGRRLKMTHTAYPATKNGRRNMLESASPGWRLKTTHTAYPATKESGWHHRVHTTSKLILRQQAITINMTSFGFHDLLKKKVLMFRFLTDYIFCRLAYSPRFSISHMTFSPKWRQSREPVQLPPWIDHCTCMVWLTRNI